MTDQPDPRVEAVREWLLTRHYTPEGAKELAPQCIAAIDALPRPVPDEIGVTEEMLDRALDQTYGANHWKECSPTEVENVRSWMSKAISAALSALDPRHRAVEPVAEDAVEAAARAMCRAWMERVEENQAPRRDRPNWVWFGKSIEEAVDKEWRDHADNARLAIHAADHARTHITWRQPADFTRTPNDEDPRWVIIDQRYVSVLTAHLSRSPLPVGTLAWAEMPERAGWATVARTATDDGDPREPAHPASTHETPGAAVLAGGDDPDTFDECLNKAAGKHARHSGCLPEEAWEDMLRIVEDMREAGLVVSLPIVPAQPSLADAPEAPAVVWTGGQREFVDCLSTSVEMLLYDAGKDMDAARLQRLKRVAFPPAPPWPPTGAPAGCTATLDAPSHTSICEHHRRCMGRRGCPHAKRGEAGNG